MKFYRPDIDGLRAVAVVSVLLYHGKFAGFSGGFVGVDVFFVISGFLISSLILADIERGRFSLSGFFERRIRRIFPALFVVILFCFVASYLIFLPTGFVNVAKAAAASSFFISNFLFEQGFGYFGGPSVQNPLLHTWSLSVEEQFYIVFPITLLLAYRFCGRWVAALMLAAAAISFVVSVKMLAVDPVAAFYLSPSRAWEFLIGYFLAAGLIPKLPNARARDMAAVLGLALICWSVWSYGPPRPFPGVNAIVPVFGAALIIHAGACGPNLIGRLLSVRPIVFIGLISYSLYLWHWPLLVFTRHLFIGVDLTSFHVAAVLGLAAVLAILTWKFVEQPFRKHHRSFGIVGFRKAGFATLAVSVTGLAIIQANGFPSRFSDDVLTLARNGNALLSLENKCHDLPLSQARAGDFCTIGADDRGDPSFIVWGDSHAAAFLSTISRVADEGGHTGFYAGRTACPPLLGVERPVRGAQNTCKKFNNSVIAAIRSTESIDTVILVARWARYADGSRYKNEPGTTMFIADAISDSVSVEENEATFARGLRRTVYELIAAGMDVTIIGPVPEVGWHVPKSLAMQEYLGVERTIAPTREEFEDRQELVIREMTAMAEIPSVDVVFPHDSLCEEDHCAIRQGSALLYMDDDHLSASGAALVFEDYDLMADLEPKPDRRERGRSER
jgi:peptidoglycan/LPS O-acetylase OafA/YrhL